MKSVIGHTTKVLKATIMRVRDLFISREFWGEYSFYMCYIALLGLIVQVGILNVELHDYFVVLELQVFSLLGSAIIFIGLKNSYQPSSYWTKLGYFIIANGPWLGLLYYWSRGMGAIDLMTYGGLMLLVTIAEGCFYDRLFDHCCDYGYRLKTLYHKHRKRHHHENH